MVSLLPLALLQMHPAVLCRDGRNKIWGRGGLLKTLIGDEIYQPTGQASLAVRRRAQCRRRLKGHSGGVLS